MNNETNELNLSEFDNGINQAIHGVINNDIAMFEKGFEQAIDARIVQRMAAIKDDGFANCGFEVASATTPDTPSGE